jgi:hypothetical protein
VKLPNADHALVDRDKITEYLLNPAHPDNGGKAKFFKALGFRRNDWQVLASALGNLALNSSVANARNRRTVKSMLWTAESFRPVGERRGSEPFGSSTGGWIHHASSRLIPTKKE